MEKAKILVISDHALSYSGVGVQTKCLIDGLLKTKKYSFFQLGAAVKHNSYNTVQVNEDFIIKPIDGFGDANLLRSVLLNLRPDALLIFTDPRFFTWLFEIEDEVRQVCPVLWWHVWDNTPVPDFNNWMYESVDQINCHSYLTYKMCSKNFANKTKFIPHSFPNNMFYELDKKEIEKHKERILGTERKDNFVCAWLNRNCKRKRPADVLSSWEIFLRHLTDKQRENVSLLLHTDPTDSSGHNLFEIAKSLNILDTVCFSTTKVATEDINILHNISDVCLNISFNEGFGLTTLEAMMTGTPIIATATGGLYRQVIDYEDKSENGIALKPKTRVLNGTQSIPYIHEDYVDIKDVGDAIFKIYSLETDEKLSLSKKVKLYAKKAFDYNETIELWDESLTSVIKKFNDKDNKSNIEMVKL